MDCADEYMLAESTHSESKINETGPNGLFFASIVHMNALDENDLDLINALQIAPRLPWTDLATVLGSSPMALSKRWDELTSTGLAWMSARGVGLRNGSLAALVDIECLPEKQNDLIATLLLDPRVVSLEECAGSAQLKLTVMVPDMDGLTSFLLDTMGDLEGVRSKTSRIVTGVYKRGDEWRLDSLDPSQVQSLTRLSSGRGSNTKRSAPRDPSLILGILERDGRAATAEIAREIGRDASSVHRQINALLSSGMLTFRCDLAQSPSGWPISCTWYAKVPHMDRDKAGALIRSLPRARMCLSITGETNLVFSIWARSIDEIPKLEYLIESKTENLTLSDSSVTLRTHKRMGWLLDKEGRSTGELVPVIAHI